MERNGSRGDHSRFGGFAKPVKAIKQDSEIYKSEKRI